MRGRYMGPASTNFVDSPVGTVHYGDVFDIPAGREKSFLQHGHVEPADKAAKDFARKTWGGPIESPAPTTEPDSSTD